MILIMMIFNGTNKNHPKKSTCSRYQDKNNDKNDNANSKRANSLNSDSKGADSRARVRPAGAGGVGGQGGGRAALPPEC